MDIDTITLEDCLEGMSRLPDKSIDCIICDLPYGTTACKWDSVIPFDKLWEQYKRISKPNTPVVLFCAQPFTSVLVTSNIKNYKHHWIWMNNRGTGFQVAKYRPMMQTEDIIVFGNGGKMNYFPQMVPCKPHYSGYAVSSNGTNPLASINEGGKEVSEKYPTNVLSFPKVPKPEHPTQKPVDLVRYLIRTYSRPGDIVLDNCMGSGTTAIACMEEDRHFIGFETCEEYYRISMERINKFLSDNLTGL